jgi:predicted RNA methylase
MPGVQRAIDVNVVLEDRWFDFYHNVDTVSQLHEQQNRGWPEDKVNFHYLPIRPKCARRVLRHLPVEGRGEYTFIDFGSGKGRALLVAAGLGFRQLRGIELRKELHDQACKNFRQRRKLRNCSMESINMDAADYEFPNEKLVLFFFNPFGSEVMTKVVGKLSTSLDRSFRDVWVVLHDPTCAYIADRAAQLKLEVAHNGYRIYRSVH